MEQASPVSIIFICSSLEPGRDGVGDYTRRLAAALIKTGNTCSIISINDRYVDDNFEGTQTTDDITINVLRISAKKIGKNRYLYAKNYLDLHSPQWISLQFVPFGFHPKGLEFGLGKKLRSINNLSKWHLMVHELWVGMDAQSSVKHRVWGWLQKRLITSLLKLLKPQLITTQSSLYKLQLAKMGYMAQYLPLFSNIPVVDDGAGNQLVNMVDMVIFGNIHHSQIINDFMADVAAYGLEKDIHFKLKMLGHNGPEQGNWVQAADKAGIPVALIGQQPSERISAELASATFGISTTPWAITDKSGSFAAMRQHGLPVISVSRPWDAVNIKNVVHIDAFRYQKGNFNTFFGGIDTQSKSDINVTTVANQLLKLLRSS